jgi:hypothetical protein
MGGKEQKATLGLLTILPGTKPWGLHMDLLPTL